ncbi:MAG: hypothetical protein ACOY90_22500 [Candidatus Zhuqueibacterota bacterium]
MKRVERMGAISHSLPCSFQAFPGCCIAPGDVETLAGRDAPANSSIGQRGNHQRSRMNF